MGRRHVNTGEAAPNVAVGPIPPDPGRMTETGQRSLLAMAHLHARLMQNALEMNAELLDFARRRVGEDLGTSERLSRSRSPAEATEVLSEFYQKALRDYAEEAEKVMRIGTEAARRSIEDAQAEADEVLARSSERVALPE